MTLIDHLMETGRVPDTAAEQVFSAAIQTWEGADAENPGPDEASAEASAPASQRLDHNAASPQGVKALAGVYGYIRQSGLSPRLVDLVYLRVSQLNGCAYCIDMHSQDLFRAQMPPELLLLLPVWREAAGLFTEQERAALAWTEAVTILGEHGVSNEAYTSALAHFDEKQLADLTIAIGLMGAYNRLAISFRTMPAAIKKMG